MSICLICGLEAKSDKGLSRHIYSSHEMDCEQYTLQYIHGGVAPLCKCGCGRDVKYNGDKVFQYREFCKGHFEEGHWGDLKDRSKHEKKGVTRRAKFASGELTPTWLGKNCVEIYGQEWLDERTTKINAKYDSKRRSETMSNVPKSKEHVESWKKAMIKYWEDPAFRERLSTLKIEYIKTKHKHYTSKLETLFADTYLIPNAIKFERFYYAKEIKSFYDFYLPELNVIIETDGDFWHCNPRIFPEPKYACQFKNLAKDKIKTQWCLDNGIKLIRIWEYDIHNNPDYILSLLKR